MSVDVLYADTAAVDNDEFQPVLKKSTTALGEYIYIVKFSCVPLQNTTH